MSPSDPVVIPARRSATTPAIRRRETPTTTTPRPFARAESGGRRSNTTNNRHQGTTTSPAHRPDAIPPAVAALLAVTSIPLPKPKKKGGSTISMRRSGATVNGRRKTMRTVLDEKDDDAHDDDDLSRSPLEILLSPAEELEEEEDDLFSQTTEETSSPIPPPLVGSRSFDSAPSLEVDNGSQTSVGSPPSPDSVDEQRASTSASASPRKERPVSSPPAEDCLLDHPLLSKHAIRSDPSSFFPTYQAPHTSGGSQPSRPRRPAPVSRPSSFRSNITASLRVLRSAAKSFSSFTAGPPTIQADDFLTRSILSISPQFTDDRWPTAWVEDTPTPAALRRYFNPPPATSAGRQAESPLIDHRARTYHDGRPWTGAIQLQTYRTSTATPPASGSKSIPGCSSTKDRKPTNRSHHPSSTPSSLLSPAAIQGPVARNREPRENSDFLRVIVLEMNMRREGKLSDSSPGKARFVLPPRQKGSSSTGTGVEGVNDGLVSSSLEYGPSRSGVRTGGGATFEVPRRWVGVVTG
ncbi:MAG: hypothetical protein M1823_000343 [Watsoniomyces obsoletus]|nr:MAG: hypothetical protein M1823_000343 [Watsoniomyces obsoletus]